MLTRIFAAMLLPTMNTLPSFDSPYQGSGPNLHSKSCHSHRMLWIELSPDASVNHRMILPAKYEMQDLILGVPFSIIWGNRAYLSFGCLQYRSAAVTPTEHS
jgi:hypothetical protein